MPNPFLSYYEAVAARMVPFLRGRKVAIEQRFPGTPQPVYRRHEGKPERRAWIAIDNSADIVGWTRLYAVAFHAHLQSEAGGCWFVLDIDARELPLTMARLAATHAREVLISANLPVLVKFSGANGFHLMWDIPDADWLEGESIWDLERAIVEAVAAEVECRLNGDPRAAPIRAAVGSDQPLIATSSQDGEQKAALLFDKHILKPNVNVRVPYSIHAASGLAAVPINAEELERFSEQLADPPAVLSREPISESDALPANDLETVKRALARWSG